MDLMAPGCRYMLVNLEFDTSIHIGKIIYKMIVHVFYPALVKMVKMNSINNYFIRKDGSLMCISNLNGFR